MSQQISMTEEKAIDKIAKALMENFDLKITDTLAKEAGLDPVLIMRKYNLADLLFRYKRDELTNREFRREWLKIRREIIKDYTELGKTYAELVGDSLYRLKRGLK